MQTEKIARFDPKALERDSNLVAKVFGDDVAAKFVQVAVHRDTIRRRLISLAPISEEEAASEEYRHGILSNWAASVICQAIYLAASNPGVKLQDVMGLMQQAKQSARRSWVSLERFKRRFRSRKRPRGHSSSG